MDTYTLIREAQKGDKEAMESLVTQNSRLVWSVVTRFKNRGCETEDLYQIGSIGLIKAIYKFSFERETKLSTYAVPMIMGEIRKHLRDDGIIKVSRSLRECAAVTGAATHTLSEKLGREPTVSEIAEYTGRTVEEITQSSDAVRQPLSIYQRVGDSDSTLADILVGDEITEKCIDRVMTQKILAEADKTERAIMVYRYFRGKTQSETATLLGMSQVSVSRAEKRFAEKVRKMFGETPNG